MIEGAGSSTRSMMAFIFMIQKVVQKAYIVVQLNNNYET